VPCLSGSGAGRVECVPNWLCSQPVGPTFRRRGRRRGAPGGPGRGQVVGATDDIGLKAIKDPYHLRDVHTTILNQLGLNQDALSYLHQGRKERLTEVRGNIITQIV